jgi:hypothetical protein
MRRPLLDKPQPVLKRENGKIGFHHHDIEMLARSTRLLHKP